MNRLPSLAREKGVAWVLVGLAVLFLACGVVLMVTEERGVNAITLPVALLASDLLIAASLISRWQLVRPIAQGLAIFGTLVHLLVLIRNGPVWTRACAGLLVMAHVQAMVLLFRMSIRERAEDENAELGPPVGSVVPVDEERGPDAVSARDPLEAGEGAAAPPVVVPAQRATTEELITPEVVSPELVTPERAAPEVAPEIVTQPVADREEPVEPVRSETETQESERADTGAPEQGDRAAENEERAS